MKKCWLMLNDLPLLTRISFADYSSEGPGPIRIRNLEDLIRQLEHSSRHLSPSGSEDIRDSDADRHFRFVDHTFNSMSMRGSHSRRSFPERTATRIKIFLRFVADDVTSRIASRCHVGWHFVKRHSAKRRSIKRHFVDDVLPNACLSCWTRTSSERSVDEVTFDEMAFNQMSPIFPFKGAVTQLPILIRLCDR